MESFDLSALAEGVDLSALFGPTPVVISEEQFEALHELFLTEGAVGIALTNEGGATVLAIPVVGESLASLDAHTEPEEGVLLDVRGTAYAARDYEKFSDAYDAAVEATKDILDQREADKAARDNGDVNELIAAA